MGDLDVSIFSISQDRGMSSGRNRRCPPAVVITHDSDTFSTASINPSSGDGLLSYKGPGGLGASTLSLATEGRNGIYGQGPLSRTGSPRHSKIHPSDGSSLPKSGSSMAVFSTDGQLLGNESQIDHSNQVPSKSKHCCSGRAKRTAVGFFLTVIMCGTWIGITHLLKWAYIIHLKPSANCNCTSETGRSTYSTPSTAVLDIPQNRTDKEVKLLATEKITGLEPYKAPYLTTWFCTTCNCLFFPVYLCIRFCSKRKRTTATKSFLASMRLFQEKGLSALHFLTRSTFFCVLWVATNYMLIYALGKLDATAVMALQASSASFVYLLSWVILHEQFVGIRIVAVILCNTGIALLAYMDGVSKTSTLGGVVLASAAAAGLAVHKVLFKKLIGSVTMGQLSLFLTLVGLLNVLLLWPIGLILYLVESEVLVWTQIPYIQVGGSALLFIVANVLGNFDIIHDYDTFVKLGIVSAVPVSAVLDVRLYNVKFEGMKLAGILLISIGFMLVLLPDNWPDYITRLIRWRCRRCPRPIKSVEATQPKSRLRASSGNGK